MKANDMVLVPTRRYRGM